MSKAQPRPYPGRQSAGGRQPPGRFNETGGRIHGGEEIALGFRGAGGLINQPMTLVVGNHAFNAPTGLTV